jgi:hypothetical protein
MLQCSIVLARLLGDKPGIRRKLKPVELERSTRRSSAGEMVDGVTELHESLKR